MSERLDSAVPARPTSSGVLNYRTVWRWHFYAGLLCIPFVLWLASTGSIFLFKPQIERWLERPYEHLSHSAATSPPSAYVRVALAAVPGSVLNSYILPSEPGSAIRVLVGRGRQVVRVFVHPQTLEVLQTVNEDERFMNVISRLHGELLQGDRGSMLVEMAASWVIVMLITGLYLWWPREGAGAAGVLYPRISRGGRGFWRDMHAVAGVWVSVFALFLLISGLPWAKSWGGMLKDVRGWTSSAAVRQDWTTGRSAQLADRELENTAVLDSADPHAAHHHGQAVDSASVATDYHALDLLVPAVAAQGLVPPVLIAPPSKASTYWTARSDTQNRPLRADVTLDGATGRVLSRRNFADKPLLDRIVGTGVAAHEGQLFAPLNQALGLFTAAGLILVSVSAIVMWWRRRPGGTLGAPTAVAYPRLAPAVLVVIIVLGALLPLLGASLITVLLIERGVLRRIPAARNFLGLRPIAARS